MARIKFIDENILDMLIRIVELADICPDIVAEELEEMANSMGRDELTTYDLVEMAEESTRKPRIWNGFGIVDK